MKITKYVHSCLLVETPDRVGLIDPGQYSWESGLFKLDSLTRLDDIIITHEHYDHLHLPFIQALVAKFPNARITTTQAAATQLAAAGLINIQTTNTPGTQLFSAPHEPLAPLGSAPQNLGVHYLGQLTHPGDSHHFAATKAILALPVTAPWGTLPAAAALGSHLKPQYIIPIHDWHWNDTARRQAYDRLEAFFHDQGILFLKPQDGIGHELNTTAS